MVVELMPRSFWIWRGGLFRCCVVSSVRHGRRRKNIGNFPHSIHSRCLQRRVDLECMRSQSRVNAPFVSVVPTSHAMACCQLIGSVPMRGQGTMRRLDLVAVSMCFEIPTVLCAVGVQPGSLSTYGSAPSRIVQLHAAFGFPGHCPIRRTNQACGAERMALFSSSDVPTRPGILSTNCSALHAPALHQIFCNHTSMSSMLLDCGPFALWQPEL